MRPVLLVIAGPNGAGKTTITERLRSERWSEGVEYLNPDEVEAALYARTQDGLLRKVYRPLPTWIADAVARISRHPDFIDLSAA